MRRDLAVCRAAQSSLAIKPNGDKPSTNGTGNDANTKSDPEAIIDDTDVAMTEDFSIEILESPAHSAHEAAEAKAAAESTSDQLNSAPKLKSGQPDNINPRSPILLDIPSEAHVETEQSGDNAATGTYSNFDFESLFNDPASAAPGSTGSPIVLAEEPTVASPEPAPVTAPEPRETKTNDTSSPTTTAGANTMTAGASNENNSFDFTDLTFDDDTAMADSDNISSLLPGLESYANADDTSEPPPPEQQQQSNDTFNIFDAADGPDFGTIATSTNTNATLTQTADQTEQKPDDSGVIEEGRDTTFDDIMDFNNFDLGDFGGDVGEGETKFDDDFFNI